MADRPVIETDVVVVGAGPAGLFQAFQLGLLGMSVRVVDALPEAGGQCTALYADKPIYDIPGLPVCTGRELTQRLLTQARPFLGEAPDDHLLLNHLVGSVSAPADAPLVLGTAHATTQAPGPELRARSVVLATGAGAFLPRGLGLAGLASLPNVHHHLTDVSSWAGQHLVVAGGGDEALLAVAQLLALPKAQRPAQITLLHRRAQFQAEPQLVANTEAAIADGRVRLAVGVPTAYAQNDNRLVSLSLLGADSQQRELPCPHLLVQLGLSPKLGPLADWGLALARKQVQVDPATFATNVPGVHAIGDAVTYPGKLRLIACGFHEATLAAYALASRLRPEHPTQLLYTSSSPVLQARLGCA